MWKELMETYRMVKETERRKKEYSRLVGQELNYTILRDIVNSAAPGKVVFVTLKDGTKLEVRQEDSFDRYKKRISEDF